jgi:ADP-heptose:LPS heptosyltransferase
MLAMATSLRRPRIDWWFDLLTNPRSCLMALLARPRNGVGSTRGLRSRVYRFRRPRPGGDPSALRHHLDKLAPLCGELTPRRPRLYVQACDLSQRLPQELSSAPVLLHPGSTWPDKAWPIEHWVDLCVRLQAHGIGPLCFVHPPGEEALARALQERTTVPMAPPLDLTELLSLVARSRLYIGNDGGILHCAVALGRPTLGFFGPTDPAIWFPYAAWGPFRVLRGPESQPPGDPSSSHPRLRSLSAASAFEAARELWQGR